MLPEAYLSMRAIVLPEICLVEAYSVVWDIVQENKASLQPPVAGPDKAGCGGRLTGAK